MISDCIEKHTKSRSGIVIHKLCVMVLRGRRQTNFHDTTKQVQIKNMHCQYLGQKVDKDNSQQNSTEI